MNAYSTLTPIKCFAVLVMLVQLILLSSPAHAADDPEFESKCSAEASPVRGRVVCADLAALEQTLVYNRFGSFNPYGMIFALQRDISPAESVSSSSGKDGTHIEIDAEYCGSLTGTETYDGDLTPGNVRLKDCKRPRPVVLRVNVGDTLLLRVSNFMSNPAPPDFSKDFCRDNTPSDEGRKRVRIGVQDGSESHSLHGEADCITGDYVATKDHTAEPARETDHPSDWPATRLVNLVAQGLRPLPNSLTGQEVDDACRGLSAAPPGESFYCRYSIDQEGTYFFASQAAPAGGEGDGGSIVHGLFGAIVAERQGSSWYRSQVTAAALDVAWQRSPDSSTDVENRALAADNPHIRKGAIDYEASIDGIPVLNMARQIDADHLELVHSDLNAIIWCDEAKRIDNSNCRANTDSLDTSVEPGFAAFREFSVFFHDELKTFYTKNFRELNQLGQLAGVKDGFAINYGASGMGSLLLANRKGIGPSATCMECLYEEFFLTSWVNGDPALLEWYADDPSNVHHSYLNDAVVFRNFHAGPKETHVFHLHAHQWFAGNDPNRGTYLDSQTVAPQQGFTYNIYHGGLRRENGAEPGWWDTQGSGNRNRTVGDSIFHCHLYPHFAQGMWALWRVHDVLEDGTRLLPDGQAHSGLSLNFPDPDELTHKRMGSINRTTGAWLDEQKGTPIPALVPLPGETLPLLPTYADDIDDTTQADNAASDDVSAPMPGYPFYIAGQPGHRAPQAPLDIARNYGESPGLTTVDDVDERSALDPAANDEWLDGGLNRHVVVDGSERELGIKVPETLSNGTPVSELDGDQKTRFWSQVVAKSFALGDLSGKLTKAEIEQLSPWGTKLERAAMGFHYNGKMFEEGGGSGSALKLARVDGEVVTADAAGRGYTSLRANRPDGSANSPLQTAIFPVNGSQPKPGAPFADPCGVALGNSDPVLDPLGLGWLSDGNFNPDPDLDGFRRYETSAVQLDMIVNRAGWHDPQARINVLSAESDRYKEGPDWRVSPVISDSEEPFFFRAFSGECIEFRHTNELPKELELDDFQVKTPTDTIGQHIHLVKFDVTSSDGSGNGWNYEDGTLAPDEIASRLCAWEKTDDPDAKEAVAAAGIDAGLSEGEDFCEWGVLKRADIWRQKRSDHPGLFQTTVQRWFADPIISFDAEGEENEVDRTMRTVFTHDHFGASSIQQHGFYSALVVEPPARINLADGLGDRANLTPVICPPDSQNSSEECTRPLVEDQRKEVVAWGGKSLEGANKRITVALSNDASKRDPEYFQHPNYREFALSIADFALLYDPRDRDNPDNLFNSIRVRSNDAPDSLEGMAKLYCEGYWRLSPALLGSSCGSPAEKEEGDSSWFYPGEVPPAWIAGGVNRDDLHKGEYGGDLFDGWSEVAELGEYMVRYRQKAAGMSATATGNTMAKPVAAPLRPESISVDHHDPYLINYRGAPLPLRVGTKNIDGSESSDCALGFMNRAGEDGSSELVETLENGKFAECSIAYQKTDDDGGDMGEALHSSTHGDPETPVLEAYQNERLVFRMIQGAQEVQHAFTVAGQPFKRNMDQHWSQGMQPLDESENWKQNPTLQSECLQRKTFLNAKPREYLQWFDTVPSRWDEVGIDDEHWKEYEKALAECDNLEGFAFAQEIGISEHFELQGSLRADVGLSPEFVTPQVGASGINRTEDGVPTDSSDYLYSYGTTDALWNGAWGLIRIFSDENTIDPPTFEHESPEKIGERLVRVSSFSSDESTADNSSNAHNGIACPIPGEGEEQRRIDAVVVAVESRRVFDEKGTVFGDGLYDPDGLFLALMSAGQIGLASIEDDQGFTTLNAENVISSVQSAYGTQPEPFVLRVRAGDCLRLRVVNLLGEDENGARDLLGDAIMPRIVPLNTDPMLEVVHAEGGPDTRPESIGVLARPDGPVGGVRPSTRLALNFGLPGLNLIRNVPAGYGFNKKALDGGNGGVSASGLIQAYAGRARLDLPAENDRALNLLGRLAARKIYQSVLSMPEDQVSGFVMKNLRANFQAIGPEDFGNRSHDRMIAQTLRMKWETAGTNELTFDTALGDKLRMEVVFGEISGEHAPFVETQVPFAAECSTDCDDPARLNEELTSLLDQAMREAIDERMHWIPYAFGAVPVKPVADVIGQVPHGLFGAIDVVPVNWRARDNSDGIVCDAQADDEGYTNCQAIYVAPEGMGNSLVWDVMAANDSAVASDTTVAIREFVLFWRDGMNLRDDRSKLSWRWDDPDGLTVNDPDNSAAHMVPDCPVCDDSYDRGEAGVNNHALSFARLLNEQLNNDQPGNTKTIHRSDDLNEFAFAENYLLSSSEAMKLKAKPGEQIVIRVVHPGGRARQRAFSMNGYNYDDLFPGFGFPRSALLAPGKSISAWLRPEADPGTINVWHDGPTHMRSAGTWGLLSVTPELQAADPEEQAAQPDAK